MSYFRRMAMAMPIPSPIDGYVKDGLILAYDGHQEPSGGVWKDLSGGGNDMIVGAGASFDSEHHCIAFTVGSQYVNGDCTTSKEVSWASAVTFEFIYAHDSEGYAAVFKGSLAWPYKPYIMFNNFLSPFLPESCSTPWLVSPAQSTDRAQKWLHQYAIDGNVYRYKHYSGTLSEGGNTQTNTITGGSQVLYFGSNGARLYAIRIYNRALTDDELLQNRTLDITRYNL